MSWMKRPQGSAAAPPGPAPKPYAAPVAQPFGNQQNMYPNYQAGAGAAGNVGQQPQQQYWQQPTQQPGQYPQQYGQVYQQTDYPANANQFYQPPNQFNQNYTNQGYSSTQQGYQQNYYQNQGVQQNYAQNPPQDGWEDNWDWGWEDSSKQAQKVAPNTSQAPAPAPQPQVPQQQVFNNANVIEESFASTNSWNWAMDEKKEPKESMPVPPNHEQKEAATLPVTTNPVVENNSVPEASAPRSASREEVRTLNDRDVVKEHLPNLALGKRFHLDNLTPQWSIESQMSQDSSDGPHTHSEGTYTSENPSRNSDKSSPDLNTDNSNFNYSQAGLDEAYPHNSAITRPSDEPTLTESTQSNSRRESHDELSSSMQEMSITTANHEVPSSDSLRSHDFRSIQENNPSAQPPPSISPANFPPPMQSHHSLPMSNVMPPAPAVSNVSVPPPASVAPTLPPPPSSSAAQPPNFPPPTSGQNPFKHSGPFSHKSLAKGASGSVPPMQPFPTSLPSANLTSPAVVSKVSQHNRVPVGGFEANLETTPDNSERPDQPISAFRPMTVSPQVPDNLEVAPRNDRNEYLQTAHLSSSDYGENTDFSRGVPPPGLRRMVVGQQESEYNQTLNISGDEPPPGLARMVPGQQTEAENSYNQSGDNYLDRHIDGQPTDAGARPYRQADGQQTPDYTQQPSSRASDRRPIGLDRMVPGEPSNDEYSQYQAPNYVGSNEQRVVTGLDHEYSIPADGGPLDVREQNVDGSDYSEQNTRNQPRNVIGARETTNDSSPDYSAPRDEQRREVTMEGENLQDLSIITSSELTYSREQIVDGADVTATDIATDRKTDLSDSIEHQASSSRRQSLNRVNTSGDDSERDRAFKSSPRRDRDKHKSSRDRDRDRERDRDRDRERDKEGRYSRGDRKYDPERSERRSVRERNGYRERRDRDESPESRRHRRHRDRYDDDTDYYSDRERERRRHREGSYTAKPPRPEDKDRRYDDRERSKRYNTVDRYEERGSRRHDRYERSYRAIDPSRKLGNLRRQRDKDERRVVTFSSDAKTNDSCTTEAGEFSPPSRADSREAVATDEDAGELRRRTDPHRRSRRTAEPFYDEYGGAGYEAYVAQRQQYQYYEHLRLSNPAAYMQLYKQIMAGHAPYTDEFGSLGYEARREERGSVHSGRSSAAGLKGNDTYYAFRRDAAVSPRDAPSLRTEVSDRDNLTTDMSLNLHLEESTVRSERMTPFRYSTAHVKGSISSRDVVIVRPSYPVDGVPATVHVLSLSAALQHRPEVAELNAFPGPLVKGVTHKKSVIDYCMSRVRAASTEGARDVTGYVLVWELLALMLRQNGVVVGSDIAELLMKNTREYEYKPTVATKPHNESRRDSSVSDAREEDNSSPEQPSMAASDNLKSESSSTRPTAAEEQAALDKLRELLIYGNRQEAIEWAMSSGQWAHALALAAHAERRARAAVCARWLASQPRPDPLHTLYAALAHAAPPAATCVADERWGDWRPHAAMLLANPTTKPEQDRRTLTQLGDSLSSRGLVYSAQLCYVCAGVPPAPHPLAPLPSPHAARPAAPPRLSLLLAEPRANTLNELATNRAMFATEVLEYARSLSQEDYVMPELQVYKLILACRLSDAGAYERALAYTEAAGRAVTRAPHDYCVQLLHALADLADRLKYHEPGLAGESLADEADSGTGSPREQHWLRDVRSAANMLHESASQHTTPQHNNYYTQQHDTYQQQEQYQQQQYGWEQQAQQYQQPAAPVPAVPSLPAAEDSPDYQPYYQPPAPAPAPEDPPQYYEDWQREEPPQQYDYNWQGDNSYGYGEAAGEEARAQVSLPGAAPRDYGDDRPASADQNKDRDTDAGPNSGQQSDNSKAKGDAKGDGKGKTGWLGGILTKLSLRAPNQMILPDDKNPTIVWDAATKRWRNTAGDEDEAQPPPPPPKSRELHALPSASPPLAPAGGTTAPLPPTSNVFKMQKQRHIKKAYVDVFNPGGAARPLPPAEEVLGPAPPAAAPPTNYFVPAPAPAQQGGAYDPSSDPY